MMDVQHHVDVAIVGGGVGGAYAAWRLMSKEALQSDVIRGILADRGSDSLRVGLYEASSRIGGRLFSMVAPGMHKLHAEIGGMRYLTSHRRVNGLVEHLNLAWKPFASRTNRYFLRGHHLTENDWADPARVPYGLDDEERGKSPAQLFALVLRRLCPEGIPTCPDDFTRLRTTAALGGIPYSDLGFWNAIMAVCSVEAYHLLYEAYGHETALGNWNTAEILALTLAHRAAPFELRTLQGGMEQMPRELVRRFEVAGGQVNLMHSLVRLNRTTTHHTYGSPPLELTFVDNEGKALGVHAQHVILALPRRALELLAPRFFLYAEPQFVEDLQAVVPLHASKLFLAYDRPWWQDLDLSEGSSNTDLPIRQCYYFGVEGEQPGADPANRRSLLLGSYNDGQAVDFWNGFVGHPIRIGLEAAPFPVPHPVLSPDFMIGEAQRQIRVLHGDVKIPDPYWSVFMDWSRDPYGGGWHSWKVHTRARDVMRRMQQPRPDINVYVVGEAWSNEQGWVEGALSSTETVLSEKFAMPPPQFLVDSAPAAAQA